MKLHHLLKPHTGINSKWVKDLNVRPQTIKVLEENIGSKILDIAYSNILLEISPQARETKEKTNKQTNGTTSNYKVFAQQRKTSTK